ncbi:hypothetical protein BST81_11260 [Leptolyngbya sp. 'hensonii']|nr:hypothetical protein BST81_11260 [Leptolyngbya sp. 'hensonii']
MELHDSLRSHGLLLQFNRKANHLNPLCGQGFKYRKHSHVQAVHLNMLYGQGFKHREHSHLQLMHSNMV